MFKQRRFPTNLLKLAYGIPKLNTFRRVFGAIDSEQFEAGFIELANSLVNIGYVQVNKKSNKISTITTVLNIEKVFVSFVSLAYDINTRLYTVFTS